MASRRAKPRQNERADQRIRDAAAEIYRVIRAVTLDEITVLDEVQVRVNGLDEARVEQYVEYLLAGGAFKDPIDLFQDGQRLILSAGWHRTEAYRRALERFEPSEDVPALAPLKAEIHTGGLEAAIEWAEEDNLAHGLELSPRDKRNILERRFKRGHEWAKLSNRALAAKLGVSRQTVANWREEIEAGESGGKNLPPVRVGADGKTYSIPGIQAANQRRSEEEAGRARLREHLLAVLLRGPFDLGRMFKQGGVAGLSRGVCWGVVTELVREGAIRRVEGDVYELVREGESVATQPAPSDNGYQMDEPEPEATGWLDQPVERETPGVAQRDNTSIEYESDEAMAARLAELLRVGSHVLCDLEDVLEQTAPVPEWVLSKLDDLSKLLHGHPGQDDVWNPGLNSLLADLNTRSRRERE